MSTKKELKLAIEEAATKALAQMPDGLSLDLALVHVSSIYGNAERLQSVVPALRRALPGLGAVVGCSAAGVVGMKGKRKPAEVENQVCFGLSLASLPGVDVQPFYLTDMDVPDLLDPPAVWKRAMRMAKDSGVGEQGMEESNLIFLTYATPQSVDMLGNWMQGMDYVFPEASKVGAMASTVSSLTRCCLFFGEKDKAGTVMEENSYYTDGLAGVCLSGDIRMRSFVSQGARRVGPTFHANEV
ncbi:unnamed protein product, partial [Choristocarpus tenellus]